MLLRPSLPSLSAALLLCSATAVQAADVAAVASAVVRQDAAPTPNPAPVQPPESCPYATIYVDWPRAEPGISKEDAGWFAALASSYVGALSKAGFAVVNERSEAYWHALLRFRRSRQNPQVYIAATSILARGERDREEAFAQKDGTFEGPDLLNLVQFRRPDQNAEEMEFGGLFEVTEFSQDRIGAWAERATEHARVSLDARIERLCSRRDEELEAEERRLENIRQSLADEIQRVRKLREKQGKTLEIHTDESERTPAPRP
jgi:hypothetical protein